MHQHLGVLLAQGARDRSRLYELRAVPDHREDPHSDGPGADGPAGKSPNSEASSIDWMRPATVSASPAVTGPGAVNDLWSIAAMAWTSRVVETRKASSA